MVPDVMRNPQRVPRVDGPVHEDHVGDGDVPAAVHYVGSANATLEERRVELGTEDVGALLLRELHSDSANYTLYVI